MSSGPKRTGGFRAKFRTPPPREEPEIFVRAASLGSQQTGSSERSLAEALITTSSAWAQGGDDDSLATLRGLIDALERHGVEVGVSLDEFHLDMKKTDRLGLAKRLVEAVKDYAAGGNIVEGADLFAPWFSPLLVLTGRGPKVAWRKEEHHSAEEPSYIPDGEAHAAMAASETEPMDEKIVEAKIEAAEARTDAKFADLMGQVRTEMAQARGDFRVELAAIRGDLQSGLAEIKGRQIDKLAFFSTVLGTGLAVVALVVAALSFGGDRLSTGLSVAQVAASAADAAVIRQAEKTAAAAPPPSSTEPPRP